MIESIYQILAKFGYTHPLHPALTHVPIGMVIGAFLFALVAMIFRSTTLIHTARHCAILGLIGLLPTALLGIMDWQHYFGGSMLFPIKIKLVLAGVLLVFLILAVVLGASRQTFSMSIFTLYFLCLLTVVGLGYFGGELVYSKKPPVDEMPAGLAAEGAAVFQQSCSACHFTASTETKIGPGLKGFFKRDKFQVSGLKVSEDNFRKQLNAPFSKMPPFGHLSKEQVDGLTAYLKTL